MESRLLLAAYVVSGLTLWGQRVSAEVPLADSKAMDVNACTLLASEEISRVVGLPVDNGLRNDQGFQPDGSYSSTCVWLIQQKKSMTPDSHVPFNGKSFVILNVTHWPAGSDLARGFLQAFREAAVTGDISATPTPRKFGDEALWWGDGLAVRTGDLSFGVSVVMADSQTRTPGAYEEKFAPYILQRIEHQIAE